GLIANARHRPDPHSGFGHLARCAVRGWCDGCDPGDWLPHGQRHPFPENPVRVVWGGAVTEHDLVGELDAFLGGDESKVLEFRRDLHAHPEVGYSEHRTTRRIAMRLEAAGLHPAVLPKGTGLIADVGGGLNDEPIVALRADIDALPIPDEKNVPYRSLA